MSDVPSDIAAILARVDAHLGLEPAGAQPSGDDWVDEILDEIEAEEEAAMGFDVEDVRPHMQEFEAKLRRSLTDNEKVAMLHHLSEQWERGDDFDTQRAFETYYQNDGEKPIDMDTATGRQRFMAERWEGLTLIPTEEKLEAWAQPVDTDTEKGRQEYMRQRMEGRPADGGQGAEADSE